MTKFTRKPRPPSVPGVDDFISAAEQRAGTSPEAASNHIISNDTEKLPWEDPRLRGDVLKLYNLRLPETYLLKLKYIADHTPGSMQKFCLDALLPAIDAKIEELTGNG
ncbi:hypothetical protein MYXO_03383 [Myxococcaceae bacterium]|nr:hypothetical protein MYXO_03383 [Myxococcaceae bacterium]